MVDKYYEIRKKKKDNESKELIVAIKENKLEIIVGDKDSLKLSGAEIGDKNELVLNSAYYFIKINEKEAQRRKGSYI